MNAKQKVRYKELKTDLNRLADEMSLLNLKDNGDRLIYKEKLEEVFDLEKERGKIKRHKLTTKLSIQAMQKFHKAFCKQLKKEGLIK